MRVGRHTVTNPAARSLRILALLVSLIAPALGVPVRHGDIIFQNSDSPLAPLIAGVTRSSYTHCGIVVVRRGSPWVLEAAGPVKYTPLQEWIGRGRGQAYSLYRLKNSTRVVPLVEAAQKYLGKPYDFRFALGGDEIYCSELVYRAALDGPHLRLARPQPLAELNWRPWESRIRELRQGDLPLQEPVISPIALTRSRNLVCVYHGLK